MPWSPSRCRTCLTSTYHKATPAMAITPQIDAHSAPENTAYGVSIYCLRDLPSFLVNIVHRDVSGHPSIVAGYPSILSGCPSIVS
eukprot:530004-Prorocentrum_minimum.AAC.2